MTYKLTRADLWREAQERWQRTIERRADLEPAVSVQRRVVGRSLDLADLVARRPPARLALATDESARKLNAGTPILAGEWIEIEGGPLLEFAQGFCEDLATGVAGGPAEGLGQTFDEGRIDIGSLVAASLGRHQDAIRDKALQVGVAPDLLWLVAELVSGPIAHWLQDAAVEQGRHDSAVAAALGEWSHGYCAVCGSWPAFAERVAGAADRSLRCSFCGAAWTLTVQRCIYCRSNAESVLTAAIDPREPARLLELCRQCGGYLKSIHVNRPTAFPLLAVEDLDTNDLDTGALDKGYGRVPLPVFPTASRPPVPTPAAPAAD